MTWNTIQQNRGCKLCSNKANGKRQALTYDYICNKFKERNCELLEPEYINSSTKIKYKCN